MILRRLFTTKEFTGAHMGALIVGFFGVVIAVNLVMAVFASRTWSGLIVENSYVASQEFNETVAAIRAQERLGWRGALRLVGGRLEFRLTDNAGSPVQAERIEVAFRRPSHELEDHAVTLLREPNDVFAAEHRLNDGLWVVETRALLDRGGFWGESFRATVRNGQLMR